MKTKVKFCKDCKFCSPKSSFFNLIKNYTYAKCKALGSLTIDATAEFEFLVSSKFKKGIRSSFSYCSVMRKHSCGREAIYFEGKN